MIDPAVALAFSLYGNKGVYALLLGSGLSRAAQIPTGWEITLDLVRRLGTLEGAGEQPDWAAWYRARAGKEPNYSEVLDALAPSPDERRAILHRYIEPTPEEAAEGLKTPTAAHRAIASLVREGFVRVIMTTNFDRLTENALRDAGVEPTVIASDDDLRGAVPLVHSRCYIVKLHGDYLDTRIKNTDEELASYSATMDALLDRILDEHGLVVCGWSGDWDHALRAAITRAPNRRYPTYWASRGTPSTRAEDLIRHRGATVVPIGDADAFFGALQQRVAAQVEAQRPDPRSTGLLVAAAKRYLGRPEHRIRLGDLVGEEHRRLVEVLAAEPLDVNAPVSAEGFNRRIGRIEAASEPLARLFGLLGRWGGEAEQAAARELLTDLVAVPSLGGYTLWLGLRTYPAVLLLYTYGLGALRAGRHGALYQWLTQPVRIDRSTDTAAVNALFSLAWENHLGGGGDVFRNLVPDLKSSRAAFSDHLCALFAGWVADYEPPPRQRELLFERFEALGALAFLTVNSPLPDLKRALEAGVASSYVFAPFGRTAYNDRTRDTILSELQRSETKGVLLQAGFSDKDGEHYQLALDNLQRLWAKARWSG